MNNFCTCGTGGDFDAADYESYWLCEAAPVPVGTKCCECSAPIPAGKMRSCATHYEVIETPDGEPPIPPDYGSRARKAKSEHEWDVMEKALDDFRDEHGWDDETERYIREVCTSYRCDRCEGEVEILAQFDVCVSAPGDLPALHAEHYWHAHGRRIRWRPGPDGVWHPQPWRFIDYLRHYRRRAYYRAHEELTWKFKYRLENTFLWPVRFSLSATVRRETRRLRQWKWQMQRGGAQ